MTGGRESSATGAGIVELRHLRTFVAIAEELHFGRAAERLHVTQPVVSANIQQLERILGARLVDRNSRSVVLTEVGHEYLADAREALALVERGARKVSAMVAGRAGRIAIGFVSPVGRDLLPRLLSRHREAFPAVDVSLHELSPSDQLDPLLRSEVDLVVHLSIHRETPGVEGIVLRRVPVYGVVSADSELSRSDELSWEDFLSQTYVLAGMRDVSPFESFCEEVGPASPSRLAQSDGFFAALARVSAGEGVTILPGDGPFSAPGVEVVDLGETWIDECLYWREGGADRPAVSAFVDSARRIASLT